MRDCIGYQGECTTSTPAPPSPLHPLTCSSDKMVKELKERLLKAKGNPSFLEGVQDINVVCGVLKDFLRCLREPLLTFKMHNAFLQAAGMEREITELQSLQVWKCTAKPLHGHGNVSSRDLTRLFDVGGYR